MLSLFVFKTCIYQDKPKEKKVSQLRQLEHGKVILNNRPVVNFKSVQEITHEGQANTVESKMDLMKFLLQEVEKAVAFIYFIQVRVYIIFYT